MRIRYAKLEVTTDGSGDGSVTYDNDDTFSRLIAVEWNGSGFAATCDATLSTTSTPSGDNQTLLTLTNNNSDAVYHVRNQAVDSAGANITGVYEQPIINGALRLVIAQGGATNTGSMTVYYE